MRCLFATDLHGDLGRYEALFSAIPVERPDVLLLGGDLLPGALAAFARGRGEPEDFVRDVLGRRFEALRREMGEAYPRVLLVLGNDDGRADEPALAALEETRLWTMLHGRRVEIRGVPFFGYSYVPPTPFLLKDWERYDVSRYVDPGCVPPDEGTRTVPVSVEEASWGTIARDLDALAGDEDLSAAVFLFHSPPYRTALDRAALDGRMVDHVPLDVHVGSIAIARFIEARQPLVTLHGHVHESARLTGSFRDRIGRTHCFGAAHDGPELALVRFDTEAPERADRLLLAPRRP